MAQNKNYTEARLLGFSYDFGITVIRHQKADTMVIARALMRGIHPLIIFKMADVQGGNASHTCTRPWHQHLDDKSWSQLSVCLYSVS